MTKMVSEYTTCGRGENAKLLSNARPCTRLSVFLVVSAILKTEQQGRRAMSDHHSNLPAGGHRRRPALGEAAWCLTETLECD